MISLWVCAALLVVAQVEESSTAPTGKNFAFARRNSNSVLVLGVCIEQSIIYIEL